jgi:hypothetical protein
VQKIGVSASQFLQNIAQTTTISSNTRRSSGGRTVRAQSQFTYPLNLRYDYVAAGSSATQTADVLQTKNGNGFDQSRGRASSWSLLDTIHTSDTLHFTPSTFYPSNGKSRQQYKSQNVDGACYEETLLSRDYVLTGKMKGC